MRLYQGTIPRLRTWHKKAAGFLVFVTCSTGVMAAGFLIDWLF